MKKNMAIFIAAVMLAAFTAGCTRASATPAPTPAPTAAATATTAPAVSTTAPAAGSEGLSTDRLELVWMTQEFVNAPTRNDSLANKFFEERFNLAITYDVVNASDYGTKLNLVMASNDLPDLIYGGPSNMGRYYDVGVLTELNPYLEEYAPDFLNEIKKDPTLFRNMKDDKGRFFCFATIMWDYEHVMMAIDTNLLDQLGIAMPAPGSVTTDDFYDAVMAMKTLDPKIIPIGAGQWAGGGALPHPFYYAFGTWPSWFPFSSEEYLYGPYERSEELRDALRYLNDLYTNKAIDQEYLSVDQDAYMAKFVNGEIGVVYGWMGGDHMWPRNDDGTWPEHNWKVLASLKGPAGHQMSDTTDLMNVAVYIPVSNKDVARTVSFLNWRYTQEGKDFLVYGIEGVTYNRAADGKVTYTQQVEEHEFGVMNGLRYEGFWPVFMPYVNVPEAYAIFAPPEVMVGIEVNKPFARPSWPVLTPNEEEIDINAQIGADIGRYVDESLPQFVVGQLNLDSDFDAFVSQLERMRVNEYMDNVRGQYDRWKSR